MYQSAPSTAKLLLRTIYDVNILRQSTIITELLIGYFFRRSRARITPLSDSLTMCTMYQVYYVCAVLILFLAQRDYPTYPCSYYYWLLFL